MSGEQLQLLRGRVQSLSFVMDLPEALQSQLDLYARELAEARGETEGDADA